MISVVSFRNDKSGALKYKNCHNIRQKNMVLKLQKTVRIVEEFFNLSDGLFFCFDNAKIVKLDESQKEKFNRDKFNCFNWI